VSRAMVDTTHLMKTMLLNHSLNRERARATAINPPSMGGMVFTPSRFSFREEDHENRRQDKVLL
jgi:hypothetical protein